MNIETDITWMHRALELAKRGEGSVEPNPMVGCLLVKDDKPIGEGFHQEFGQPHAEINAIEDAKTNGYSTVQATAFVTLEPCSHTGKTGPCTDALIAAGVSRVVIGHGDPFPDVSGQGIAQLANAGMEIAVGTLQQECESLNAPYLKRIREGLPWIIAKWAMTLDGKIATTSGDSRWISNSQSRQRVQRLRGRVDAVVVGINTVLADDPMLNSRPKEPKWIKRIATRVVLDSDLRIGLDSRLVQSACEFPVLISCGPQASTNTIDELRGLGCEVWQDTDADKNRRLHNLLSQLSQRGMTNVLVEGGSQLLGSLHDQGLLDELHVSVGTQLFGSQSAPSPIAGQGISKVAEATEFKLLRTEIIENDLYAVYRR